MRLTAENMKHTLAAIVKNALGATDLETVRNYLAGVRAINLLISGEKGAERLETQVFQAQKKIEAYREKLVEIETMRQIEIDSTGHFKSDDGTVYWTEGDKAIVDYFGNDPAREGSRVEVEVVGVEMDRLSKPDEVCVCRVKMIDSVGDGEDRVVYSRRWGSQMEEVSASGLVVLDSAQFEEIAGGADE